MIEQKKKPRRSIDILALLMILAVSVVVTGAYAQSTINQAEGEDVDIFVTTGMAFQDGNYPASYIAFYTPTGNLNTSNNEFYISASGGGMFDFVSNETFELQFVLSVSATIQGDQGNNIRGISHNETNLSEVFSVDAGDHVTVYWAPTIDFPFALPIISFWGMIGGSLLGSIFIGASIKRRNFTTLWIGVLCLLAAFIFFLIFINI